MDSLSAITYQDFEDACQKFLAISERLCDEWELDKNIKVDQSMFLRKETFVNVSGDHGHKVLKAEYVISYNINYNVPTFAFNYWNPNGVLLTLEEIRQMCLIEINEKDFYSVVTQQEHPIIFRPFFIIHPCHTEQLLSNLKKESKNLLVTFISLISPIIKFNLPFQYALQ